MDTIAMKMNTEDALEYINNAKVADGKITDIKADTYYKLRRGVLEDSKEYLYEVARTFPARHRARQHEIELIDHEMWKMYNNMPKDEYKERRMLLKEIRENVMYMSAFDEAAAAAMEQYAIDGKKTRSLPAS